MKAQFSGVCACCGTQFSAGTEILQEVVDGGLGWIIAEHADAPPVERVPDICPKCHTAKSLNGTCMCEE